MKLNLQIQVLSEVIEYKWLDLWTVSPLWMMDSNKYNILNWLFKLCDTIFQLLCCWHSNHQTFFGLGITPKVTEVFLSFEKITVTMIKLNVFTIFIPIVNIFYMLIWVIYILTCYAYIHIFLCNNVIIDNTI